MYQNSTFSKQTQTTFLLCRLHHLLSTISVQMGAALCARSTIDDKTDTAGNSNEKATSSNRGFETQTSVKNSMSGKFQSVSLNPVTPSCYCINICTNYSFHSPSLFLLSIDIVLSSFLITVIFFIVIFFNIIDWSTS